ncbi:MAG: hypothetical protein COB36_10850 [Alphaproteobacteria bacterium]|nr:MAG: hypothetical protein COB36_10850 [Alphaproteobacteria bacterium]
MQQTKLGSLYESIINIIIGAVVAFVSQLLVFPMFGIDVPLSANLGIMAWFTLISVVRSYVVRRWFNAKLHSAAMKLAGA